jgi:pimeloyl-ACP methyl ester carboxylesterase
MRCAVVVAFVFTLIPQSAPPEPTGRLIDLGGHHLHLNCSGHGRPTVVVENGLGDFSFDWLLVQREVDKSTRICTYDRAGYAWSDPGPKPRTFDQLNLELHDALARAGERGPFVLVGHSFGGGVVRAYVARYPLDVLGLVLVDIVSEDQIIPMGKHAGRIRDGAKSIPIPIPRETMGDGDARAAVGPHTPLAQMPIEPPYDHLPPHEQQLHSWAAALPALEDAENSQREWSAEYFARWHRESQTGSLGSRPLVVLTRATGGYGNDLDVPAAEIERIRLNSQRALVELSTRASQQIVNSGHNMHLEVPDIVTQSILRVVHAARN